MSVEKDKDDSYVRNSSFLSRDIEGQKNKETFKGKESPPKTASPKKGLKNATPPMKETSPPKMMSPPKAFSPPSSASPPKKDVTSPPKFNRVDSSNENSVAARASRIEAAVSPPKKEVTSPPVAAFKLNRSDSKVEDNIFAQKITKRENSIGKEIPVRADKLAVAADHHGAVDSNKTNEIDNSNKEAASVGAKNDESVGVGDKIKKFEKAVEEAAGPPRPQRSASVRRRDSAAAPAPAPAQPVPSQPVPVPVPVPAPVLERQHSLTRNNSNLTKWPRSDSQEDRIQKPEPQKIIKPEFKPPPPVGDVTIRSPSLGAKAPDRFPSHGTAFRNVASPDQPRPDRPDHRPDEDNIKPCKLKNKEKYSVSKGSSYFTRGSEEIWLVKKKDIEEIEERVLDSFRRAGACGGRTDGPAGGPGGQGAAAFSHTLGRGKRQMYARSESLDPQWAGARAQTLKRQTSVACTCGHDKKPRAKSAGGGPGPAAEPRARARSHGDDQAHGHVLDKYETLV